MFQLTNATNPAASTHAGVLEFIAEEGVVHLPYWMMKTLRLDEGDPIRITGAEPPKGKFVKLQAQSTHFLEISDPKAVCVRIFWHRIPNIYIYSGSSKLCATSLHSLKVTSLKYITTP
jgi:hypothetical protein